MFAINDSNIKQLESDLGTFASRSLPFATRNTIMGSAVAAQRIARDIVSAKMTERNKFTRQSIQFSPKNANKITLNISRQKAFTGSTADYMEDQEFGGTKTKTGKHGVAIPTSEASGEGPNAFPRKKLVRKPNRMANIKFTSRRKKGGRRQRNKIVVMEAIKSGRRFVFLDLGRRSGIFRVMGGKRNPKLRKMYDLSKSTVVIPKRPWLAPAVDKAKAGIPAMYKRSLEFQAKRQGLFKNR